MPDTDQPDIGQIFEVCSVFDPDGGGADFAYTIGLAATGLPELHLWARPDAGEDPGADWALSPRDRHSLLTAAAGRLAEGSLAPGDTWEEFLDGGHTTLRFELRPPLPSAELDAFGAGPTTLVCGLSWSLHRSPVAEPRPLSPDDARAAASSALALEAAARGAEGPEEPPAEAFGPWGTAVHAARRALRAALDDPARDFRPLYASLLRLDSAQASVLGVASAAARDLGRVAEVEEAQRAASGDARVLADELVDGNDEGDASFRSALRRALTGALAAAYVAWVVRDGLDEERFWSCWGPIEALVDPAGTLERFCSDQDRAQALLRSRTSYTGPVEHDEDHDSALAAARCLASAKGFGDPCGTGDPWAAAGALIETLGDDLPGELRSLLAGG